MNKKRRRGIRNKNKKKQEEVRIRGIRRGRGIRKKEEEE